MKDRGRRSEIRGRKTWAASKKLGSLFARAEYDMQRLRELPKMLKMDCQLMNGRICEMERLIARHQMDRLELQEKDEGDSGQ